MKADQDKVREAIKANPPKGQEGHRSQKEIGAAFGISGPRVCQIAKKMVEPTEAVA